MVDKKNDIERNAFVKGYNIIYSRHEVGPALARIAMNEISHALKEGGLTKTNLSRRKSGFINHTPSERAAIEQIFLNYGVSEPWGLR